MGIKINVYDMIVSRFISSIIIFILAIYLLKYGYIFAPVITVIYYYIYEYIVLDNKIKLSFLKMKNTINGNSLIKRKCLTCTEKDTCKNQAIDIKCNKY